MDSTGNVAVDRDEGDFNPPGNYDLDLPTDWSWRFYERQGCSRPSHRIGITITLRPRPLVPRYTLLTADKPTRGLPGIVIQSEPTTRHCEGDRPHETVRDTLRLLNLVFDTYRDPRQSHRSNRRLVQNQGRGLFFTQVEWASMWCSWVVGSNRAEASELGPKRIVA